MVQPDGAQVTVWGTRIECVIPKAKNTHSEYEMLNTFPQQFLHERSSKVVPLLLFIRRQP